MTSSKQPSAGPWVSAEGDNRPLAGVRILELATVIAGPFAGMLLADFGADVIKVEHPTGDPRRVLGNKKNGSSLDWKRLARNKRLVVLDLHTEASQQTVRELARTADVVIENFRPGTLEKWNLGYDALSAENPGLVMLRVTGWGQTGPYKNRPGFGSVAEAMAGFAAINGEKGGPPLLPPFGLADHISGIYGAFSVLMALRERDRSGKGQVIDLAICESIFSVLGATVVDYDQLGYVQKRMGNRVHYSSPRNVYKTSDGEYVALSGSTPNTARRVFDAIERAELADDPKFATNAARLENADELDALIADWIIRHPFDFVLQRFEDMGAALAPVLGIERISKNEHFLDRETIIRVPDEELGAIRMQGIVPKMSRTPGRIDWAGGRQGRHHEDILGVPLKPADKA
ncbi:MAG: CoA transferase [Proteobacteria bacterium]|jgi:crotonobetainyl-CoA:carnitine CoA-transferase CaiB-like acyl-CoA transferase|nr:CoA transferase [Pseudomonadota bacterium]